MKVVKFGGTSLATAERFKTAVDIILSDPERRVCICSAPGRQTREDIKVTDLLIQLAAAEDAQQASLFRQKIENRFTQISKDLQLDTDDILGGAPIIDFLEQEEHNALNEQDNPYDRLLPLGEFFSASLMASYLRKRGVRAKLIDAGEIGIHVYHGKESYHVHNKSLRYLRENLNESLKEFEIIVVPGFYGKDKWGKRRPLSRGGSDVTASWIAAALSASCEIWTDVSGVYEADPKLIPAAWSIPFLSYDEMLAMARFGAQVLHPEAIKPILKAGQKMFIKNSFKPNDFGTEINEYNLSKRVAPLAVSMKRTSITNLIALNGEGIEERQDLARRGLALMQSIDKNAQIIDEVKTPACLLYTVRDEYALQAYRALWFNFIELSSWNPSGEYNLVSPKY